VSSQLSCSKYESAWRGKCHSGAFLSFCGRNWLATWLHEAASGISIENFNGKHNVIVSIISSKCVNLGIP
jgi:hypothetical protein